MATIRCRCGGMFSNGAIPCAYEYHALPDVAIEGLVDKIIILAGEAEDVVTEIVYSLVSAATYFYKCPHCGRLIVFWDGLENIPSFYEPE